MIWTKKSEISCLNLAQYKIKEFGGLKWDTGDGRVAIRAEGDGWCAYEF